MAIQFIYQPAQSARLGEFLQANLQGDWTSFRAAIAFVKRSGTKHITARLAEFARRNPIEIIVGIDHQGTSQEGLQDLLAAVHPRGQIIVFHNRLAFTFHPKIYLFKSKNSAELLIGSGNLTEGGLFTNYEASVRIRLDLADGPQRTLLESVENVLDDWADPGKGIALTLDGPLLNRLVALGYVPVEALSMPESAEERVTREGTFEGSQLGSSEQQRVESPFAAHQVYRAPNVGRGAQPFTAQGISPRTGPRLVPLRTRGDGPTGFVMTLQRTDVGVGQTTRGTSRRSPEIFIPLRARDAAPEFWGWPREFVEDARRQGKFDRNGVQMRIGTEVVSVNMMTWPVKHDFRLRSEALRSSGKIGDIMRIERVDPSSGFDYYVEVIPEGTTQYPVYLGLCVDRAPNSLKRYGYY